MTPIRTTLFLAIVWLAVASFAAGRDLSTLSRATQYPPITNPTAAQINFVTYGNAAPPGSVWVNGGTVRILRGNTGAGLVFTTWACTQLHQANVNNGSPTNDETRDFAREIGVAGDQAGHIFADRLGFSGKVFWNIMPIAASVNKGHYSAVEGQIATELATRGSFYMYVRGEYAAGATRPHRIHIYIHQPAPGVGHFECLWIVNN